MDRFLFPRWVNRLMVLIGALLAGGGAYGALIFVGATSPVTLNIGYQPEQPIPFSHAIHAGQLRMDCRYCHNTVFDSAHAAVPPTATCINCHSPANEGGQTALSAVHAESPKLKPLHESWKTGKSVAWKKVHNLPDFVFFNHAAHVNSGVSCVRCHGRIDKMDKVYVAKEMSMRWCLECHRDPNPEDFREVDLVTKLDWKSENAAEEGRKLMEKKNINPDTNCAVCHR